MIFLKLMYSFLTGRGDRRKSEEEVTMGAWRRYLGKPANSKKNTSRRSQQQQAAAGNWLQSKSTSSLRQALRRLERKTAHQRDRQLASEDLLMEQVDSLTERSSTEAVDDEDKRELQRVIDEALEDRFDDDDDGDDDDDDGAEDEAEDDFEALLMSA
jgi:hypothetical protein